MNMRNINQEDASKFAKKGFELFKAKMYQESEKQYIRALEQADPNHWSTPDIHGEFALVLEALNKYSKAGVQRKESLEAAIRTNESITALEVTLARYFFAEHLIKNKQSEEALELIDPFLGIGCEKEWFLLLSKSKALHSLNKMLEAKQMAEKALNLAPEENRANIETSIEFIFNENKNS